MTSVKQEAWTLPFSPFSPWKTLIYLAAACSIFGIIFFVFVWNDEKGGDSPSLARFDVTSMEDLSHVSRQDYYFGNAKPDAVRVSPGEGSTYSRSLATLKVGRTGLSCSFDGTVFRMDPPDDVSLMNLEMGKTICADLAAVYKERIAAASVAAKDIPLNALIDANLDMKRGVLKVDGEEVCMVSARNVLPPRGGDVARVFRHADVCAYAAMNMATQVSR